MFKVNNKDTRTYFNFKITPCSTVSTVNFEYVIAGWEVTLYLSLKINR